VGELAAPAVAGSAWVKVVMEGSWADRDEWLEGAGSLGCSQMRLVVAAMRETAGAPGPVDEKEAAGFARGTVGRKGD
jgi:hypothetical protein